MEIIISANEKILALTGENKLASDMTEKEFEEWLYKIAKVGNKDETEV